VAASLVMMKVQQHVTMLKVEIRNLTATVSQASKVVVVKPVSNSTFHFNSKRVLILEQPLLDMKCVTVTRRYSTTQTKVSLEELMIEMAEEIESGATVYYA